MKKIHGKEIPFVEGLSRQEINFRHALHMQTLATKNPTWLVMTGDWGGEVYLTIPYKLIGRKAQILALLRMIDKIAWDCNEGEGALVFVESPEDRKKTFAEEEYDLNDPEQKQEFDETDWYTVGGGMGGGLLQDGLWVHDHLREEIKDHGATIDIERMLDILQA
ncbi:hypothetical protein ACFL2D_00080 [Patescibacteria group bacterium]